MKSIIFLFALGVSSGLAVRTSTPQPGGNRILEKEELSPLASQTSVPDQYGLVEVKESEIPDGAMVYVFDEINQPKQNGETMETADNIVFRPLFQYRNKQEALARRRISNGYRRRYFIQQRPYRNAYYYRHPSHRHYYY